MTYPFEGPESERKALTWMESKLQEVTSHKSEGQASAVDDLRYEIGKRLGALEHNPTDRDETWYEDLWDRFIFAVSGVRRGDGDSTWESPHEWREWEYDAPQRKEFGYSKEHLYAEVPQGGGSSKHYYSGVPPPIQWTLTPVVQKGLTFYIGRAKVAEIDAVCSVPQLPKEIESEETALRVLDKNRGDQQWQRRLDPHRVLAISNFIDRPENIIANSAIIYAPECDAVRMEPVGVIRVDLSKFLVSKAGAWTDHSGGLDRRPMWLIDGQHRVRGLAQSPDGIEIEIPIILFPPEFRLGRSAKIFAEINTLQTKLTPLHTLFMQHRFGIPSPVAKRDFGPWDVEDARTFDSRANHLSFECAAYLTSQKGGPLYGLVKFLDQNSGREYVSQAHQWVDFTRNWFLRGGPYPPGCKETQAVCNAEVENFFRAFVATCNHGEWPDGKERWSLNTWKKGLLQRQGPSQALLRLYPVVWTLARRETTRSPIPEQAFREVLRPLMWVDWMDLDLISTFSASGERARSALRIWMETAIRHGRVYPRRAVMSRSNKSEPGKGILSPPGNSKITVTSGTRWPTRGRSVKLSAVRPVNTLPTSKWTILNSRRDDVTGDRSNVPAEGDIAEFVLDYGEEMDEIEYLEIRVDWANAVGPTGHSTIRLRRP
jgi:DGQHR domain-containing protein